MNLKLTIPSVLLSAMAFSCAQPHEMESRSSETVITLTASQSQTRTVLGEPVGDKVPVYWASVRVSFIVPQRCSIFTSPSATAVPKRISALAVWL